ncbi:MAG: hypothetical protein R2755_08345 [Acidimicrobiales bacterium]
MSDTTNGTNGTIGSIGAAELHRRLLAGIEDLGAELAVLDAREQVRSRRTTCSGAPACRCRAWSCSSPTSSPATARSFGSTAMAHPAARPAAPVAWPSSGGATSPCSSGRGRLAG